MTSRLSITNTGHSTREGGNVLIYSAEAPAHYEPRPDSLAVGPLEIRPWHNSEVVISDLSYRDESGGSVFGLFGAMAPALVASGDAEEEVGPSTEVTRRGVIAAGALVVGAGALADGVRAGDFEESTVAAFDLVENPQGVQLGVVEAVEGHLPAGQTYYVDVDGRSRGTFEPADGERFTLNPGIGGRVEVRSADTVGPLKSLYADLLADDTVKYQGVEAAGLTTGGTFADRAGKRIVLNDHILADAVKTAGADETALRIEGQDVPHADESADNGIGYWHVQGTELLYTAGSSAPDARLFDVTINESALGFL